MNKFIITFIIICMAAVSVSAEDFVFSLYDIEFPSIKSERWVQSSDTIAYTKNILRFDLLFYLDPAGKVDSFDYKSDNPTFYIRKLKRSLENLEFYAARRNGEPISFVLPAELYLGGKSNPRSARLKTPYDEINCLVSQALAKKALELNNVAFPGVSRFPSYNVLIKPHRVQDYPYLVYSVKIDSSGNLLDYQKITEFGQRLASAVETQFLYADFKPLIVDGKAEASEFYLVFRFFDRIEYPAAEWPSDSQFKNDFPFAYYRMEVIYFKDSILNKPFPINTPDETYVLKKMAISDELYVMTALIDSAGIIEKMTFDKPVPIILKEQFNHLKTKLRFTPARDWDNNAVAFEGKLRIFFKGSKTIRIVAEWLY